jgi:hypothetical protein
LPRSRLSRGRTPSLPGIASLSPVSSMAQKLVEVRADRGLLEQSSSGSFVWPARTATGAMAGLWALWPILGM